MKILLSPLGDLWKYLRLRDTWKDVWKKLWEPQGLCKGSVCTKKEILPLIILFVMVTLVLAIGFFVMSGISDYISGLSGEKVKRWIVFGL